MAINLQSSNTGVGTSNISLTVNSADGLAIIVLAASNSSSSLHTAVSHNGKSFTKVFEQSSGTYKTQGWILTNPDTGSYPVVLSGSGSSTNVANIAVVMENVDPADPVGHSNVTATSGTSHSVSLNPEKDNSFILGIWSVDLTSNQPSWATNGSGQTELDKRFIGTSTGFWTISAYKSNQSIGSNSLNFSTVFSQTGSAGGMVLNEYTTTLLQPSDTLHGLTNDDVILATDQLYSYGYYETLPTNDDNLTTLFTPTEYDQVDTNNGVYFTAISASYNVIQFKKKHSNNTDQVNISLNGRSNKNASLKTIYLQIYNYSTGQWETLDSDNTTLANNEFTLTGTAVGADYFTTGNWIAVRSYQ